MLKRATLALGVALTVGMAYAAPERATTLKDQQEVAVTIYNKNLALVKDTRKVKLISGEGRLAWRDVSAHIRPETALLRNLTHAKGFYLIEQNFDFDLLTPQKLLEKYIGQTVTVIRTHPTTGVDSREEATVLATNGGAVLKFADRIETGIPGRLAFKSVPENLRDRPTLVISLNAAQNADDTLELSYLTGGLAWKADYVAELSKNDDKLDLNGWVTLTNTSGTAYQNARLQLVVGDVNRVNDAMIGALQESRVQKSMAMAAPKMAEESLFEYHLYTLDRLTTIAENQTKQVALLSASSVPTTKEFLLRGADYYYRSSYGDIGQKIKVGVFVEFDNKGGSLGIPLPKGVVRVYKKDNAGNAQFVGEDHIDHTPKNEKVRLKLGDAFDVTADKKQTSFEKIGSTGRYNTIFDAAFEIVLKNAKDEPVTVKLMEPIPGDWQMLSASAPHQKEASNTAVWNVTVPANGKTTLAYKVRVRY
ncbi:MAG: DUF4139 domain-containing protein [Hydrogenophilales bacterium CG_4_9_14_3_um_filter_59_35]|nr:MAG: DUF4139 domain-containing protein [Hydrogenophilales bacterium CG18_big_fil_WC_8_21_14_2_50_58_12]PIY01202.1 MAG: DUF4139 domain-containing protein [Hydrogenophilales bacterium CG_4_10_14_3_um_filter_58_23]PJB08977.1 MAG: DUF4139 domain-containing protein [Hydrogenophilales bacterium CG_4_9_14_3_um_filter_59_35]